MPKRCNGTSVGVLPEDEHARIALVKRETYPYGWAPISGHEEHGSAEDSAHTEAGEEASLALSSLELVWKGRVDNLCRRLPADPPGHYWWIFTARATGELTPAPGETRDAAWFTRGQIQDLADRTCDYVNGLITEDEWQADPGLELVWMAHLHQLQMIRVHEHDLDLSRRLAATAPEGEHQ